MASSEGKSLLFKKTISNTEQPYTKNCVDRMIRSEDCVKEKPSGPNIYIFFKLWRILQNQFGLTILLACCY